MGTRSVYMDNANEAHNMIILKHFTEKNKAVVVDVKTRKRKAGSCALRTELQSQLDCTTKPESSPQYSYSDERVRCDWAQPCLHPFSERSEPHMHTTAQRALAFATTL